MKTSFIWIVASSIAITLTTLIVINNTSQSSIQKNKTSKTEAVTRSKKTNTQEVVKLAKKVEKEDIKKSPVKAIVKEKQEVNVKPKAVQKSNEHLVRLGLDKTKLKVEFAPLNNHIQEEKLVLDDNTTLKVKTYSLNDSLVKQEVMSFESGKQGKYYLVGHNFETEINIMQENNQKRVKISKQLLTNKLDTEFLKHSILKHPRFLKFDQESKTSYFETMVGIPNTDALVIVTFTVGIDGAINVKEVKNIAF